MTQVTKHFRIEEFDCKDGSSYPESWVEARLQPLAEALEVVRKQTGTSIRVLSGYRTPEHNKEVGGAKDSMHLRGVAADIKAGAVKPHDLYQLIETLIKRKKIPDGGLGLYPGFVHYDLRTLFGREPTRW